MTKRLFTTTVAALTLVSAAAAQTQLSVHTNEPAWISVDQQRSGLTTALSPLQVSVTSGKHVVAADALTGSGHQEMEVDAQANTTTYLQMNVGSSGLLPSTRPFRPATNVAAAADEAVQQQKELAHRQRQAQIGQLEQEMTNLEQQMATAQSAKDAADQARQNCQTQQQNMPAFLAVLKAGTCTLAQVQSNNAQQQMRQLQVAISSKQRELQRLEREDTTY